MVFNIDFRNVLIVVLFLSFFSCSFAAFPDLSYTQTSYPSGGIDVEGEISSGTQISLFVNGELAGRKDFFADSIEISLIGGITNVEVGVGQNIVFRNDDSRIYNLIITGDGVSEAKTLTPGDTYNFKYFQEGELLLEDDSTGEMKKITVSNVMTSFVFEGVEDNFADGDNDVHFLVEPLNGNVDSAEFDFSVNYRKYSNTINVNGFDSVISNHEIDLSGYVVDATSPLYYGVNINGPIGNLGVLSEVVKNGNRFNITADDLREGVNTVRFVSVDSVNTDVFNGEKIIEIEVDTVAPQIEVVSVYFDVNANDRKQVIVEGSEVYANDNGIVMNISADAVFLDYTLNGENSTSSEEFVNGSLKLSLNDLNVDGERNDLTLIATDRAGNVGMKAVPIYVDGREPDLEHDTLSPDAFFKNKVSNFFFEEISGKTNKPNVDVTVFTLPEDASYYDSDGNSHDATCEDFASSFVRSLGQLDRERVDGPEINLEEVQASVSLGLVYQKDSTTSDSEGNFELQVGLQEKTFDRGDYNSADDENQRVDKVDSENQLCFILEDKFGNYNIIDRYRITLDSGNTMWRHGEISTIPNTIYASEIEQDIDKKSGKGNVRFGVIVRFQYLGPGDVTELTNFHIEKNTRGSEYSKYASIVTSEVNWRLDKDTGELIAYFPVDVSKMNIDPLEYPDSLDFAFGARFTYDVNDKNIPIDTVNPVYFHVGVNVERPLDSAKWLTPEMINDGLKFLNKSIKFTEKAADYMGTASVVGVLACTGAKFWYGMEVASIKAQNLDAVEEKKELDEAKETMFMICDRVACTASPQKCEGDFGKFNEGDEGILTINSEKTSFNQGDDELRNAEIVSDTDDKRILADFNNLNLGQPCDFNGDGDYSDGVLISGDARLFEESGGAWYLQDEHSIKKIRNECAPAKRDSNTSNCGDDGKCSIEELKNSKVNQVDLKGVTGACFTPVAPEFDNTRCNFFGLEDEGAAGWDPADNILESIRCGCITDTYSHLKNYLKVQEAIRGCLEQAKIGETKGSYCERLMSQAVCDIATNVLFKTVSQESSRYASDQSTDYHQNPLLAGLSGAKEGDQILNDRYKGTFYTQAGISTDQIVNKVCLGAFTGDWSALSENILGSVDQNEVEPVFGPMFPESRLQGYNPLTGDLSIRYLFTYATVSGGQEINTEVTFICDKSQTGGEHCPDNRITSKEGGASFSISRLYTAKGASKQDSIVALDTKAKFRYNVIKLEHTYMLKGEKMTKVQEENIFQKGEFMLANCYFTGGALGAGAGYSCDTLFDDNALASFYTIDEDKTSLVPKSASTATYYPGNWITADLHFRADTEDFDNQQTGLKLYYKVYCGRGVPAFGYKSLDMSNDKKYTHAVVPLLEVPDLGVTSQSNVFYTSSVQLLRGTTVNKIRVESRSGRQTVLPESFSVQRIIVNGVEKQGSQILFNIDKETGYLVDYTKLINPTWLSDSEDNSIVLQVDRDVENINIILETSGGNFVFSELQKQGGVNSTDKLENVQEGTCTAEMRLVPNNIDLTASNFATYDVDGENIDSNFEVSNIFKETFTLKNTPTTDHKTTLEIVSPVEGQSFCVDSDGKVQVPIVVSLQSSDKGRDLSKFEEKFEYDLSLENYQWNNGSKGLNSNDDGLFSKEVSFDFSDAKDLFSTSQPARLMIKVDLASMVKDNDNLTLNSVKLSSESKYETKYLSINLNNCNENVFYKYGVSPISSVPVLIYVLK